MTHYNSVLSVHEGHWWSRTEMRQGVQKVAYVGKGVVYLNLEGVVLDESLEPATRVIDHCIKVDGIAQCFCDGSEWQSYNPKFRKRWTKYFLANRKQLALHFFLTSSVVKMGVQIVATLMPELMTHYSTKQDFWDGMMALSPNATKELEQLQAKGWQ